MVKKIATDNDSDSHNKVVVIPKQRHRLRWNHVQSIKRYTQKPIFEKKIILNKRWTRREKKNAKETSLVDAPTYLLNFDFRCNVIPTNGKVTGFLLFLIAPVFIYDVVKKKKIFYSLLIAEFDVWVIFSYTGARILNIFLLYFHTYELS